jgi:hypothetical protein
MRCESPFDSLVAIHTAGILGLPMQMNVFLKGGFMEIIAWISVEEKNSDVDASEIEECGHVNPGSKNVNLIINVNPGIEKNMVYELMWDN